MALSGIDRRKKGGGRLESRGKIRELPLEIGEALGQPVTLRAQRLRRRRYVLGEAPVPAWETQGQPEQYSPGSWGPSSADELLARDGRVWRRP